MGSRYSSFNGLIHKSKKNVSDKLKIRQFPFPGSLRLRSREAATFPKKKITAAFCSRRVLVGVRFRFRLLLGDIGNYDVRWHHPHSQAHCSRQMSRKGQRCRRNIFYGCFGSFEFTVYWLFYYFE